MGIVELDENAGEIRIRARIFLYGDAASEALAAAVAGDIQQHWNAAQALVQIRKKEYRIIFLIDGFFRQDLAPVEVYENDDPLNNYFRVEEEAGGNISSVDDIGSNTGYFKLDNLLNNSTTAAHEFGHSLGLLHPNELDIRGQGAPGIMYPRGTIVDPGFQYDPAAMPATNGGTMNPFFRRVLQKDIDDLHIHRLSFNENGIAIIGAFSSVWHDKLGDPA
ncbi:MAG: peptidase m10a and m12b matrixin and adamalysin [Ferruginibacter sp.]|nr:peptidase m10a and m12b matrixin and adamalysin [Ferruginibacter sp.]